MTPLRQVRAGVLDVAYHESGPADGPPVLLLHGFPYDIHAYAEVAPLLAAKGCRVIVPYLRGYGSTRFLDAATPRSGEQARASAPTCWRCWMRWPSRAPCSPATTGAAAPPASWPRCGPSAARAWSRSTATTSRTSPPPRSRRRARERAALLVPVLLPRRARPRRARTEPARAVPAAVALWSPTWTFDDATFERSAAAFDNPDFVDVVIHSYRHRFGLVAGDPAYDDIERRLAAQPPITVPAITFDGADDGVMPIGGTAAHARHFTGRAPAPRGAGRRPQPAAGKTAGLRRRGARTGDIFPTMSQASDDAFRTPLLRRHARLSRTRRRARSACRCASRSSCRRRRGRARCRR